MALTKQQIRDYVRGHLDIEIEDLSDAVLDVFLAEGFNRIVRAEKRWPWTVARWTITTVAAQSEYDLDALTPDLREIGSIVGPRWTLKWLGADTADHAWPLNVTQSSEPTHFSQEHRTLYLHPTPDGVYSLQVRGYRTPTDFFTATAGDEPDLPDELHNTVALWGLSKAYAQQDDPEMAAIYERQFADELNLYRRRLNDTPAPQPIVMNHGPRVGRSHALGLRYDWEF